MSADNESCRAISLLEQPSATSLTICNSRADSLRQVLESFDQLDKRAATVLRLRYGLDEEEPLTLKQIGERLGLTRERVRQIETEALDKLREDLGAA